ncbi:DNA topoisomerase IB [Asticcacaulis sp. EMRT-3]|uniref:DNA topoisomerase IB n=1 Tax=Asticcacaulis sp. EMRT-3 TaxID=3040349 RepID=UPI0024AEA657|nr:DNA topoisomerase IB [Asticcacaulis sp. EMRT-3]MDI7774143.1 DNA topoisomerase IB [Asticcacaulis sp. EMRT-3]
MAKPHAGFMKTAALLDLDQDDPVVQARACGLRYVSDTRPGFSRRKFGKHFVFYDQKGERITDKAAIARIRKLAIPPAYRDVWICPQANGHMQATGFDARGRKQYRYHPDWRALRESNKFNHILAFGERLPAIRDAVDRHMRQRGLSREKVLATVVALLERTLIRVGNDEYARKNNSFGLTTLLPEHVEVSGQTLRFRFTGKSGKSWNLKLSDRRIARIVQACAEIDGQELFKYKDEAGEIRDVTSGDVNAYLREITGEDFTAKDFRTWTGTVLAALALRDFERFDSAAQGRKNVVQAIEKVAKKLGNTPTVCRKSYVHPQVIEAYLDGSLSDQLSGQISGEIDATLQGEAGQLSPEELLVLAFLKSRLSPS